MQPLGESFYASWRKSCRAFLVFQDGGSIPPERLLQSIWHHQRLLRDSLRLTDGRSLRVLHPGFWNHGAGPDFRDAVLQFDNATPISGDVELDLDTNGWHAHGHDRNAAFSKVRLHVVWNPPEKTSLPTLRIADFLDAPPQEIGLWLGTEAGQRFPEELLGQCASPLRDLTEQQVEQLLNEAALVRLHCKASDLHARARQSGWEQALWEGLLRALGYKQNVWPMQRIGELREKLCDGAKLTPAQLQSRLLGVSGLLPSELSRENAVADRYTRVIWDQWWREREEFADCLLPRTLWRLHGLRPANHPQRRLALASYWWSRPGLVARLEKWFTSKHEQHELAPTLLDAFQAEDDFWSWHWTLRSTKMDQPQPLLGSTRVADLAVNVVLPWLWVRAREGQNPKLQDQAEARYFAWPAAEDNSVLRMARDRLLGGRAATRLRSAAMQQGLIQVVRDFCDHANALCTDCKFPDLVRNWKVAVSLE